MRIRNVLPCYKDEGEVVASAGDAKHIKNLDGKLELKGGSRRDRTVAGERIECFTGDVTGIRD